MMRFDHIGWITENVELFEKFWCSILGYKEIKESNINPDLCLSLFGFRSSGKIKRYQNKSIGPDIEIHFFEEGSVRTYYGFNRFGINHICIHTGEKNSRERFIKSLPEEIKIHKYKNPGGWMNYFILDYEGNWIELREDMED